VNAKLYVDIAEPRLVAVCNELFQRVSSSNRRAHRCTITRFSLN